jgi:hypothetical protein
MAHFAEIDGSNKVLRVIVVSNNDIIDQNGNESEQLGKDLCNRLLGGNWVQTSYNANFRGSFASIGCLYDPIQDIFYADPSTISNEQIEE